MTRAVARTGILERLAAYDPHVVGTPPLGLAMPESDIDIVCHAPDPAAFAEAVWHAFGRERDFLIRQWIADDRPVIASFHAHGWPFELFGAAVPVVEQSGWRHFRIEQRLLALGGPGLRAALLANRRAGAKTEPAFAASLGLAGNPYQVMLDLADAPDADLIARLVQAGFARSPHR